MKNIHKYYVNWERVKKGTAITARLKVVVIMQAVSCAKYYLEIMSRFGYLKWLLKANNIPQIAALIRDKLVFNYVN